MGIESNLTLQKFGYKPEELSEFSTKSIVIVCDFCFDTFDRKKAQFAKPSRREYPFACSKCDGVKSNWKRNNPSSLSPSDYRVFHLLKKSDKSIDWDATKAEFGYTESDIGPRSEKPVITICAFCMQRYIAPLASIARTKGHTCCKGCSALKSGFGTGNLSKDGLSPSEYFEIKRKRIDSKNLNVQGTIDKYKYSPLDISPRCERPVIIKCFSCGVDFERPMSSYTIFGPEISCGSAECLTKKVRSSLKTKYGVEHSFDIPGVQGKLKNPKTEQIVEALLRDIYKVETIRNHVIGPYSFDFFLPDHGLLIECQGDHFHDFKTNGYSGTPRDQAKVTYVANYTSYKVIWIWEHEIYIGRLRKILSYHLGETGVPELNPLLSELNFKEISQNQAHSFLTQFHYLGNVSSGSSSIGAFAGEELIAVICIGVVTRHESIKKTSIQIKTPIISKDIREIRRFCIRPNVNVKNLGSFCISKFINLFSALYPEVKYLISFSHSDVGDTGGLYKACNFKSIGMSAPSYHYMDGAKAIHKRTIYKLALSAKLKESEFVEKANLVKIVEKPKNKWIYHI